MAKNNGVRDAKLSEGGAKQIRLRAGRPDDIARTVTMAEPRAIEYDDAVVFGSKIDEAAGFKVLDHASIAVQKHKRITRAALNVMKPHALHLQKLTLRRIITFGLLGGLPVEHSRSDESCCRDGRC